MTILTLLRFEFLRFEYFPIFVLWSFEKNLDLQFFFCLFLFLRFTDLTCYVLTVFTFLRFYRFNILCFDRFHSFAFWPFKFFFRFYRLNFFLLCFDRFDPTTVVSVLLTALVKRCFVSRMRDFFYLYLLSQFSFYLLVLLVLVLPLLS